MAIDRKSSITLNLDDPPNSRLFIVGSKLLCEEDFRNAFERFGNIEEIWVVKDKQSGENKGVTYIKYSKTSEAAKALEAMNGKCIGKLNRSIRVMIASSRDQGSRREYNEEEKTQRLFVIVPKTMTDSELFDYFQNFGDIDYATIIRDKETRESKGFAYVKYFKFSHAAEAFERCDRKYKAVFAEPRKPNVKNEDKQLGSCNSIYKLITSFPVQDCVPYNKLVAIVCPSVNQDQLWKLFDIVPGLDYCQLKLEGDPKPDKGIASIVYNNAKSAAYAREKLHGFEYPPGKRLIVKPDYQASQIQDVIDSRNSGFGLQAQGNILESKETTVHDSNLVNSAGTSSDTAKSALSAKMSFKDTYFQCSVRIPELQPLVANDEVTVARCFIVCIPSPLPNNVLKNLFSRFGNLIDVYMLSNRNCGFAKYACKDSAEAAIKTLHGAEVSGIRIKVLKAEEKQDSARKRQRVEDK